MDCFNEFAEEEMVLASRINGIDEQIKFHEVKISELNNQRDDFCGQLDEVRIKMKKYLEKNFNINTQN